jgi:hypothetical protein
VISTVLSEVSFELERLAKAIIRAKIIINRFLGIAWIF